MNETEATDVLDRAGYRVEREANGLYTVIAHDEMLIIPNLAWGDLIALAERESRKLPKHPPTA